MCCVRYKDVQIEPHMMPLPYELVIYSDIQAREIPGIKIYRFESSLYYANAEHFLTKLFHKSGVNPRDLKQARKKLEKKHKKQEASRAKQLRKRHVDVSQWSTS